MYLRLAFAVAAHLESDVLLLDEVLAVGDIAFQKKCLGKMGEVASQGRAVLFVSHSMAAIQGLCTSAAVLTASRLSFRGPTAAAIRHYLAGTDLTSGVVDLSNRPRSRSGPMRMVRFWVEDESG